MNVPYGKVLKALPGLLEDAEGNFGVVLKHLKKLTIVPDMPAAKLEALSTKELGRMQPELLKQIRDIGMPIGVERLRLKGINPQEAFGRVAAQSAVALGQLPERLHPAVGKFELTNPDLPAKLPVMDPLTQLKVGEMAREVRPTKGLARAFNPVYRGEHVFGSESNIGLDAADAVAHWQGNTAWWSKSILPLLEKLKDPRRDKRFVADMVEGFKKTKPLSDKMDDLFAQKYQLEREHGMLQSTGAQRLKMEKIKVVDEQLAALEDAVRNINDPVMRKWANQSGAVRIMLGLEDDRYPWVNRMLHPAEAQTRDAIRNSLDMIMKRADELGLRFISRGKYAPHSQGRILRELGKTSPAMASAYSKYSLPEELRWAQRSAGSVQWWPVPQHIPRYYADAHRILAFTPVLRKWRPILKQLDAKGMGRDAEYFTTWLNDLSHGDRVRQGLDKYIDWLVGVEYMDKVGLSFGTALKHSVKALKGFAFHPLYYSKGALSALNAAGEYVPRRFLGTLNSHGVNPDNYARFARYYLQSRALFRGFTGIDPGKGLARYVINSTLAQPTATVEAFERFSVMTGMMMKGMAETASLSKSLQQMWHSLIDISFVGQVDRYPWLKNPLQRFLMLFYYTPMRVTEQSLKTLGYAALPERMVKKTAYNVLEHASRMRRDPLGGTYMGKLARAALVIGGAEALARAHDSSIYQWATFHLPFLRESRTGDPEFVMPPVVDMAMKINQLGWNLEAFWAALWSHFGMYSVQRLVRMSQGDTLIPDIYKPPGSSELEQKLRSFFVLPSLSAIEQQHLKHLPLVTRAREQRFEMLKRQGRWRDIFWESAINALNYTGSSFTHTEDPEENAQP